MYYDSTRPFVELASRDFGSYLQVLFSDNTPETKSLFTSDTGVPYSYMYYDNKTCMVLRMTSILLLAGFKSFLISSVLLSVLSYIGLWKIYKLLCSYYPELSKILCYAVLFVPSITFWGSGILKDTYTMAATGLITFSFHELFIKKRLRSVVNWFLFFLSVSILLSVKPYIFMTILPCLFIWLILKGWKKPEIYWFTGWHPPYSWEFCLEECTSFFLDSEMSCPSFHWIRHWKLRRSFRMICSGQKNMVKITST